VSRFHGGWHQRGQVLPQGPGQFWVLERERQTRLQMAQLASRVVVCALKTVSIKRHAARADQKSIGQLEFVCKTRAGLFNGILLPRKATSTTTRATATAIVQAGEASGP